jgi:hypothetical protein
MLGSRAYVEAHAAELDRAALVLISDHGAGAPHGWETQGRDDLSPALGSLASLLEGLGGEGVSSRMDCGSDQCPFALLGVPALALDVDGSKYEEIHHLPSDTVDKVSGATLARGAAVVAVTTWAAADLPERFGPRIEHAEIAEHLKKAGLDVSLAGAGLWKP